MDYLYIVLPIAGFFIGAILFFFIGVTYRKTVAEREIGSAEQEATRLINEAIRAGESRKKNSWWKPRMKSINLAQNTKRK